jgi:hypothetical protein
VSELVTNASVHAHTAITVTVAVTSSGHVRIEVADDSPSLPEPRTAGAMTTTGRGLLLLSAYGDWGIAAPPHGMTGKTVWFEPAAHVAVPAPRSGKVAVPGLT